MALTKVDAANLITGLLPAANGGTGGNSSASTGIASVSSGTWSYVATTGSGSVVLATAPTMTNPVVGTQSQGDASTKAASTSYVDIAVANAVAGVNPAVAVQAATTAAGDTSGFTYNNGVSGVGAFFTGSVNTAVTIDGYTFTAVGQRLLVKNDTQSPSGAFNGVYYVTQIQTGVVPPIFTRALDYNTPAAMNNTGAIPVINGTVNGTTSWVLTSLVVTVGTTPLTFTKFTRNPADYLLVANNLSDVASALTSFNNISGMTLLGDIIYGGSSGARTILAGQTTSTKKFLSQTGNGSVSAAPAWAALVSGDIPNNAANTTGSSASVTSTTANPATAGVIQLAKTDLIEWRNNANSANKTLGIDASDQLAWAGTAFLSASAVLLAAAFPALTGDITTSAGSLATAAAATQNNITSIPNLATVGTITTGTWSGTAISAAKGGTGGTSAASTGIAHVSSGTWSYSAVDLSGADATGALAAGRFPALTGDITTSAGALATTAAATQANIVTLSKSTGVAVHGTNTNDAAAAGYVGEYIEAKNASNSSFPATGTWGDANSISLTAGDWNVTFLMASNCGSASGFTAATAGISTTTGNSSTGLNQGENLGATFQNTVSNTPYFLVTISDYRMSLSGTTTVYWKFMGAFSGTAPVYTYRLSARRIR